MRAHLATLVEDFRRHGEQIAVVVYPGNRRRTTSYAELANLTGRFSASLANRGIGPGERVVLWGENSAEWIAAFFACLLRGIIAVPLDAAGTPGFAARVIADVDPKLIVGDSSLLRTLTVTQPQLAFADLAQSLPRQPLFSVDRSVSEDTPLQIIFTSGTTSEPKGIVHTHRNVLASVAPIEREMQKYHKYERWVHPLRFLHTLPLSHVFGQFMGLWIPPLLAAEVHFESRLEPARLIAAIHRQRISVLAAVPRALEVLRAHLLAQHPALAAQLLSAQAPAWKRWWRFRAIHRALGLKFWAIVCGGASLPVELEAFWNTLGFALIQGYGLTETAALVTLNHPFQTRQGTVGRALPGRELRLSANGEILVRGPMLSTATWQAGRLHSRQEEWLATGDIAEQQPSGEFRFLGRQSDVLVSASGMNIHVSDLEGALNQQAGVRSCAIVPCPAGTAMEPVAVVLFTGTGQQLHAAIQKANLGLAEYQRIRRWLRWPEMAFPYTSTGKLLRRKIAAWACAALTAAQVPTTEPSHDPLLRLIASIMGETIAGTGEAIAGLTDASRLTEDLRLDSLGRVQLQSALERELGIDLADNALEAVETLGELRALIAGRRGEADVEPTLETMADPAPNIGAPAPSTTNPRQLAPTSSQSRPGDHLYPRWPWSAPVRLVRLIFVEAVLRPLVRILAAPQVLRDREPLEADRSGSDGHDTKLCETGMRNTDLRHAAPPPAGPLLLIANHVTAYDAALILFALPAELRRRLAIAMSGEMLLDFRKARGQGNLLLNALGPVEYLLITALFNVFPLPRSSGFRRSFAHAGEALDRGYSVLIFPEGHRSVDGALQPFRAGVGLLAAQSRVAVLPIALKGLGELRSSRGGWLRSGKLTIRIGKTIPIDPETEPAALTRLLEEAVRQL